MKILKHKKLYSIAFIILIPLIPLNLCLGYSDISFVDLWQALLEGPYGTTKYAVILWWVRMPELIVTLLAGATLAVSGAALQTLVRNPLADPYLLGISSGGSLGAAIAIAGGLVASLGVWILPVMSFVFALLASLWIYRLAYKNQRVMMSDLLLAGVALNLCLSALLTLILTLSGQHMEQIWRWLIGHVDGVDWQSIGIMTFGVLLGMRLLFKYQYALMLMEGGEEFAWSLGVDIDLVKRQICIACALLVGVVVAYCGMIGFIGLMTPHFLRPYLQGHQKDLLIFSAIYGGIGLVTCHTLGKLSSIPLPIGLITSCLGGCLFLLMLKRNQLSIYH